MDVVLQPGDFYFGSKFTRIRTLLGSCISITAWHPQRLLGGMCHYILPSRRDTYHAENNFNEKPLQGKYADEAMALMLTHIKKNRTFVKDYEFKIFGGGDMFPQYSTRHKINISSQNIDAALQLLAQHNIEPLSVDVGSSGHRNVIFEIWSGSVWVRYQPLTNTRKRDEKN